MITTSEIVFPTCRVEGAMRPDDELTHAIRVLATATRNHFAYMEGVLAPGAGTRSAARNIMAEVQARLNASNASSETESRTI